MEAELQSAASIISDMDKPASAAAKVKALCIKHALKIKTKISAFDNLVLIHPAIVAAVAG